MKRSLYLSLACNCLVFILSCNSTRNIPMTQHSVPVPREDSVMIELPEDIIVTPQAYRPSFTIINDMVHTRLSVKFDWQKQYLYGKEWLTLKPHFYPTDTLTLDAKGMDLNKVELVQLKGNIPLRFEYDSLLIHIHLDKAYKRGEQFTIFIDYTSKPNELKQAGSLVITSAKGLYFINADEKDATMPRELWTQGETESNSVWFPTIDKPGMKTTLEISMTIEDGFVSLSNGLLVSSRKNPDKTHTDTWKLDQPIPPYLVMMAAGPFAIVKDRWKNIEVSYYVDKEYEKYARKIFGNTPEMIQFFSDLTGVPFAWPKYSQLIAHEFVTGSMENATAVIHGSYVQMTPREMIDGNQEENISHELFHHWFGDLVTCESWSNLTLNESFADYGEYLWNEHKYGRDEADYEFMNSMNAYLSAPEYAELPLVRYFYDEPEDVLDLVSYNKGGRILHMLRNYVGDDAFFNALHEYLTAHKFGTAEAHDLRLAFEKISGQDLNWFFNQWYFSPGHPSLNISYQYDAVDHHVTVSLEQIQDTERGTPIFRLPVAIDIYASGKVKRHHAVFDQQSQVLTFPCETKPDLVNFDADKMLLCTKNIIQSDTTAAFQYRHAPLFTDRIEAMIYFRSVDSSGGLYNEIITEGLNDPFWSIRLAALYGVSGSSNEVMKNKVAVLAVSDKNSSVRAGALQQLASWNDLSALTIARRALNDSSYLVIATALDQIHLLDSTNAYADAQKQENENSDEVRDAVASIYAANAGPEKNDFMLRIIQSSGAIEKYGLLSHYAEYLSKNAVHLEIFERGLPMLYELAERKPEWWLRFQAVNTLVIVQNALNELPQTKDTISLLEQLTVRISEIQSAEQDERLRSIYGLK
ncbi:MAG: M1 family metallopeptidase [Chitinophagales bacterium]